MRWYLRLVSGEKECMAVKGDYTVEKQGLDVLCGGSE